ncbi:biopolymer transporter Tol, partial [Erwinia amylovora]|nr:biopolymer transporter Tol [Erwinia amylovora]
DGSHYCVLVSRTTAAPQPGSDEINRAYDEGWVGNRGYLRADGSRQRWALAFIGDTLSASGEKVAEVFLVDLPEKNADYAVAGEAP